LFLGVRDLYAWMTLFLCIFTGVCILGEFYKGARTRSRMRGENFFAAIYNLTMQNTRRYGGYVIHLAMVFLFIGFAGLAFKSETKALMNEGDLIHIKDYMLRCDSLTGGDDPNYTYRRAVFSVTKNGHPIGSIHPERRFYKASQQPTSHVAIKASLAEDLYVVLDGEDPDTNKAIIEVFVNPLVDWVWIGMTVLLFGSLLAMVPSRVEKEMAEIRKPKAEAVEERHAF